MPESPSDDGALVQSLLRGLDLLRRLAPADEGLTLREAAEAMGLKQPTAYKLLQTLVAAGFAEKTARPVHYTLGAGVLDLANQYAQRALLRRAEVTLTRLFAEFREYSANVVLTEAPAGEVEVVLRLSPERPGVLERPRGRVMPAYSSACSIAFQAFWTDHERSDYQRRHPFWEEGAFLWDKPERFDEVLAQVRFQGYADPILHGRRRHLVAVPVFSPTGQLVAALGVSLPEQDLPEGRWEALVAAAVAAARQLANPEQ